MSMTEDDLHIALVKYIKIKYPNLIFFHIPNGGKRNIVEAIKFEKMGVMSGVADLFFLKQRFFLELKSDKGRQSKKQKEFEAKARECGYYYEVSHGLDKSIEMVDNIVKITK